MTASQLTVPPATCTVLLLAESEGERERWLQVLGELQRLLLDARPRPRPVYTLKEAYDNGLPLLPHTLCAAIIGEPRAEGAPPARAGLGEEAGPAGMMLPSQSPGPPSRPDACSPELRTFPPLPGPWLCEGPGLGVGSPASGIHFSALPFLPVCKEFRVTERAEDLGREKGGSVPGRLASGWVTAAQPHTLSSGAAVFSQGPGAQRGLWIRQLGEKRGGGARWLPPAARAWGQPLPWRLGLLRSHSGLEPPPASSRSPVSGGSQGDEGVY